MLNIETVKKIVEVAEFIGERSQIQINSYKYKSRKDALRDAEIVATALSLEMTEDSSKGHGWITLRENPYNAKVEITIYFPSESEVLVYA